MADSVEKIIATGLDSTDNSIYHQLDFSTVVLLQQGIHLLTFSTRWADTCQLTGIGLIGQYGAIKLFLQVFLHYFLARATPPTPKDTSLPR